MKKSYYDLNIINLRYFVAACEYGSLRKASAFLDIRESTISRRIRDMEDAVGASLFLRHSYGIEITLAGRRFLSHVRKAIQQMDDGAKAVAAIGRSEVGHIKIGIFSSLASGFLFDLLQTYDKDHSGILVELIEGNPAEHVAAVRQLQIDVAFITGTTKWSDCETECLWSERVFAVLPGGHHLAAREQLDWHDLADESFIVSDAGPGPEIHDFLVQRLANLGHHPEIHEQYVGRDVLLSMVAVGHGLTLTSEATTGTHIPGIVYRPIAGEILPFSAVWSPKNDNPACRRLLSLARSMARTGKASFNSPASAM